MECMASVPLQEFIEVNHDEIVRRCHAKVVRRIATDAGSQAKEPAGIGPDTGVGLFLNQLGEQLRNPQSQSEEIRKGSVQHAVDRLRLGFTVSQVVHDYGDVCQSVTDLAVETNAPVTTDDFRTLNRCLDDAIAGAVTEYARQERATQNEHANEMRSLIKGAIMGFEAIQTGAIGTGGTTGNLLAKALRRISELIAETARPTRSDTTPGVT